MASKARNVSFLLMSKKVFVDGEEEELNRIALTTYLQTYLKRSTLTSMYEKVKVVGDITIGEIMDSVAIKGGLVTNSGIITIPSIIKFKDLSDPLSELDKFLGD